MGRLAGHSLDVGDRVCDDNGASPIHQWRELPDHTKLPFSVQVEHLVVDGLGHTLEMRWNTEPGVDEKQVQGVVLGLHPGGESIDVRQRARVA